MARIIETFGLTKKFGNFTAVEDITFGIEKGEVYGFIGLNGAGKTTIIRMMLGLIAPTKGKVQILGQTVRRGGHGPWERVGCLVDTARSYPELTVRENLEISRRIRGVVDETAVNSVIEKLKLARYENKKAGQLSSGNSQRLGLAKALLHNPDVLILDEPTNALDPAGIVEVRELIMDLSKNQSVTVFVSSHILGEVSRMTDRIGIVHEGRLIQEVKSSELKGQLKKRLNVDTRDNASALRILSGLGYDAELVSNGQLEMRGEAVLESPEVVARALVSGEIPLVSLYAEEEDLEAYFLRVIRQSGGQYE